MLRAAFLLRSGQSRARFSLWGAMSIGCALIQLAQSQANGTGELRIRLLDCETGEGLYNAQVVLRGLDIRPDGPWGGYYCLHKVPAGEWQVVVSRLRYRSDSTAVRVRAGRTGYDTVSLRPAAPRVVVADVRSVRTGYPVRYARVVVDGTDVADITDEYGEAVLSGIPTGVVTITVSAENYFSEGQRTQLANSDTSLVRFTLRDTLPDRVLNGRVTDRLTGRVLDGVRIWSSELATSTTSDGAGHFRLAGLRPGWSDFRLTRPGYISRGFSMFVARADSDFAEIVLYDSSRTSFYGWVRSEGGRGPLEGTIRLSGTDREENVAPGSGFYRFFDVPAGTYLMEFSGTECFPESVEVTAKQGIPVRQDIECRNWPMPVCHAVIPRLHWLDLATVGYAPLVSSFGEPCTEAGWPPRRVRVSFGYYATSIVHEFRYRVLVGVKLVEWLDEGGTREGAPSVMPLYVTLVDGWWFRWMPVPMTGYVYAMGSLSGSAGVGAGLFLLRRKIPVKPGIEGSVVYSWNRSFGYTTASLGLSVALGDYFTAGVGAWR